MPHNAAVPDSAQFEFYLSDFEPRKIQSVQSLVQQHYEVPGHTEVRVAIDALD